MVMPWVQGENWRIDKPFRYCLGDIKFRKTCDQIGSSSEQFGGWA